ncbi:MAG: hypothetical protein ISR48_05490 [Alphaproteobacteria bacterium]|nr:hypothetical protein [Alphaproteobacteria bacterium]
MSRGFKNVAGFALVAVFLATGAFGLSGWDAAAEADDDDDDDISRVEIIDGVPMVTLDPAAQKQSGIIILEAEAVRHTPEFSAFGRVLDIQPLLDLRARYDEARVDLEVAQAALAASKKEAKRLKQLRGDISAKTLQQAVAARDKDRARTSGARRALRSISDMARRQWGGTLAQSALGGEGGESDGFEPFVTGRDKLILVTLPAGKTMPSGVDNVAVFRNGGPESPLGADFISPAPQTDPVVQGETYFFRASAESLRSGMVVDVRISSAADARQGIIVPHESVVWYSGGAWVYLRADEDHFVRRAVPTVEETSAGWFVADALKPGDELVLGGAQMLLSEEFRWQIRGDDDD